MSWNFSKYSGVFCIFLNSNCFISILSVPKEVSVIGFEKKKNSKHFSNENLFKLWWKNNEVSSDSGKLHVEHIFLVLRKMDDHES